jgi:hypothetical protein
LGDRAFSSCSCFVLDIAFLQQRQEAGMQDKGLDRQGALLLAIGWLAALWITLT